ncbi:MAG: GAF domain-containing sensor histidine kinase [Pseudomonadota bacterium]
MGTDKGLENSLQQLRLLNEVAKDITSTIGLGPRLGFICQSIIDIMGVKGVSIRLLDEKTNRLELASACGLSEAYIHKGPVDADKSLAKALEGTPHFVLDASKDPGLQYPEEARREGLVSVLSLPLKGRAKVIGTLRLYTGEKRAFSQDEIDFLSALAAQGAISLENARIYDTLEKQDRAKSEFIMMMTHEMKGPLMAIQGLLDVMQKGYVGDLTDKQKDLIDRMRRRIKSLMEVITGLLDIYEWQSQRPDAKLIPLSLKEQTQRAVDLFRTSAREKGLTLDTDVPDEDLILKASVDEIEKVLNNLITNAIKYTPIGGTILIALSASGGRVILTVKDTGIGIAAGEIPKIFDEFFRTKSAKKIDPYGKGLGLSLVKQIVESLGGTISVKSEEGKGSAFILTFPRPSLYNL